jgi:hypothetical protein
MQGPCVTFLSIKPNGRTELKKEEQWAILAEEKKGAE